jgi:histidyl-tRNA synthetase
MGVFKHVARATAQVLVLNDSAELALEAARIAAEIREAGISVELYGAADKLGKQLKYADRAGIPIAVLYGEREKAAGIVKLKDLRQGAVTKEHEIARADLATRIRALIG